MVESVSHLSQRQEGPPQERCVGRGGLRAASLWTRTFLCSRRRTDAGGAGSLPCPSLPPTPSRLGPEACCWSFSPRPREGLLVEADEGATLQTCPRRGRFWLVVPGLGRGAGWGQEWGHWCRAMRGSSWEPEPSSESLPKSPGPPQPGWPGGGEPERPVLRAGARPGATAQPTRQDTAEI